MGPTIRYTGLTFLVLVIHWTAIVQVTFDLHTSQFLTPLVSTQSVQEVSLPLLDRGVEGLFEGRVASDDVDCKGRRILAVEEEGEGFGDVIALEGSVSNE